MVGVQRPHTGKYSWPQWQSWARFARPAQERESHGGRLDSEYRRHGLPPSLASECSKSNYSRAWVKGRLGNAPWQPKPHWQTRADRHPPGIAGQSSAFGVGTCEMADGARRSTKATFTSDEALTPTQINEQIVLYIMSRVVLSFLPRLYSSSSGPAKGPLEPLSHPLPDILSPEANPRPIPPANVPFAIVATLSWGLVMYIFRHRGERLQPGIVNSMREYGSRWRTKAAPTRLSSDAIMGVAWAIQPCHKHGRAMRAPTLFLPASC